MYFLIHLLSHFGLNGYIYIYIYILHGSTALVDLGLLIVGVSRSDSDTPHSVGRLWMTDRRVAEPYT
jgi:hypothetical protein